MAEKKIKLMSIISILVGLSLIVSPKISNWNSQLTQTNLINTYNSEVQTSESVIDTTSKNINCLIACLNKKNTIENKQVLINTIPKTNNTKISEETLIVEEIKPQIDSQIKKPKSEVVGILKIEKINFKQAILRGATKKHLDKGASMIDQDYELGTPGNLSIAGHRNIRTYGKNFNRLSEMAIGDIITVESDDKTYSYTVNQFMRVKPEEVWVIGHDYTKTEITLITCDYVNGKTVRIVVKGILNQ